MLKLNTKDIVKRAAQLADLENSDFISWNENMQMLNEAYQKIYQKLINHDDKTYMVKVNLTLPIAGGNTEVHYSLPDDFYQLYSLTDAKTGKCVVRKSINEPINSLRYDIINNELVIYGNHSLTLEMAYFPVPETLTLQAKPVSITFPDYLKNKDFFDVCDKKIVVFKSGMLRVYDIESETQESVSLSLSWGAGQTLKKVLATKYGVAFISDIGNYFYLPYNSLFDSSLQGEYDGMLFINREKRLFRGSFDDSDNGLYEIVDSATSPIKIGKLNYKPEYAGLGFIDLDSGDILYNNAAHNKTVIYAINAKTGEHSETEYVMENDAGYIIGDFIYGDKLLTTLSGDYVASNVVGVNKIDNETGYGYTTFDGDIRGVFEDTEIEYPNNLFIQLISYYMAIQYKSKQNAECSGLVALYQNIEEQFYDSIGRDDYQYTRIQNVY